MFKYRIITILILLPLVLWAVFFASPQLFAIGVLVVLMLAGYEWARLSGVVALSHIVLFIIALLLSVWVSLLFGWLGLFLSCVALLLWLSISIGVFNYPRKEVHLPVASLLILGVILLSVFSINLIILKLHSEQFPFLFYVLLLVWVVDSGAYCVGKLWGKHKLLPHVSPAKTVEGLVGGVVCGLVVIIGFGVMLPSGSAWFIWLLMGCVTIAVAVFGDLALSMFKRMQNVKDTGVLLPGHGGVLDRIDSLLIAVPVFVLMLVLWIAVYE